MNDDYADRMKGLTDDQVKAMLPTQAAHFFTKHPALLTSWRLEQNGDRPRSEQVKRAYFMSLPPEEQYGVVIEASAMMTQIGTLHLTDQVIKHHKIGSKMNEVQSFFIYGINLHLSCKQYELLLRALLDQLNFLRTQVVEKSDDEEEIEAARQEMQTNRVVFQHLLNELGRFYPQLAKDAKQTP